MTNDDVIIAIKHASQVFVQVTTCFSYDGSKHHVVNFRVRKEDAIAAIKECCDSEYEPNVIVSDDRLIVTIGTGWMMQPIEDLTDELDDEDEMAP